MIKNQIDQNTFGNIRACYALVKILNESFTKRDANKILCLVEKMTKHYRETLNLGGSKSYFCYLVKNDYEDKIQSLLDKLIMFDYPKIGSLLNNINSYFYKKTMKD